MPTYDYECPEGHIFEEFQSMNEQPVARCPQCGKDGKRLISSGSALMFKGSGFYITDYKKKNTSPSETKKAEKSETKVEKKKPDQKSDG